MSAKKNIGIFFGGKSVEHEVSVQSAKNVYDAMDKDKYDITMIGVNKAGKWVLNPVISEKGIVEGDGSLAVLIGADGPQIIDLSGKSEVPRLDAVFPIVHGQGGEDGTIQGLLKLLNVPFVGPSVLGSAVGMDKEVMKRLLKDQQIPSADYVVLNKYLGEGEANPTFEEVVERVGLPCFVKPANLGSSVGISKANSKEAFEKAVAHAFRFDTKLIVETNIIGREIECAVLGNENPKASILGEVKATHEFYSYEAKYLDEKGAVLDIPAQMEETLSDEVRALAVKAYKALYCEGLTRVDFFITREGEILINEVNTIPGFTKISMYPKLWGATGLSYPELIDALIDLALERHAHETALETSL